MSLGEKLHTIALPVMVLVLVVLGHMMRMTRAAILNVMQSAYVETAELKGLRPFTIIARHALPNAISPVVNVVMLNLAYLVVGVVVVEVVFVYPGMGQYLVDHVSKRDVPVVQACGLVFAAVYIGLNLVGGCDFHSGQPAAEASEMTRIPLAALIGLFFTGAYFFVAIFASWLAPYGMADVVGDSVGSRGLRPIGWAPTVSGAIC